ncbi:hypothetical protein BDV98DRAFT_566611 [Pterulicium gracile]|uniref:P-loop containing nucleoside triphosphate hydrolase protein n=1 Tax=Pterulicium gracile TaxID=1884261 RepID=A0A5C3QKM3_9AGAR|nr:hypothetical protein BDV98DRAFT_566611 [Pterula gracilis]
MKEMTEQNPVKVCWFIAPTVMLCDQQKHIIKTCIPVPVAQVNGQLQPDQWKDRKMWRSVVDSHRIVVSTPQVLLDALRHGYLNLANDISLLVFDEAHHAVDDHPYNRIMTEFYHTIPPVVHPPGCRPRILGLTASPIYGGNIWKAFQTIQANLDARVRTSCRNKEELARHVFRPTYKHIYYPAPPSTEFSTNLASLDWIYKDLDIEDDPYVRLLRKQLSATNMDPTKRKRLDQKLSKAILKGDTYTHKSIRDFAAAAQSVNGDVGPWAADWYIYNVITKARESVRPFGNSALTTDEEEKIYLINHLQRVQAHEPSYQDDDFLPACTAKVNYLIDHLLEEKEGCTSRGDKYSGLVFVQRRDCVIALSEVLRRHPRLNGVLKIGSLVGTNDSVYRRDFLDLSRGLLKMTQNDTLDNFKIGEIDLIVSTSVAEEGIDIQACCHVVRWDPPPNMASWLQSRGRARKMRSTYALMQLQGGEAKTLDQWKAEEQEMTRYYNTDRSPVDGPDEAWFGEELDEEMLTVECTGAMLTLPSAVSHLEHFCAAVPHSRYTSYSPIYDIDPPDVPHEWHVSRLPLPPYTGPFGSRVTLPRVLPAHLREFSTETKYPNKVSAHRHAAFKAYKALHEAGLLNEHLLPITSILEPKEEKEVTELLKDVEKRASVANVTIQMDPWIPNTELKDNEWWLSELEISSSEEGQLDTMQLLTKIRPVEWDDKNSISLYSSHAETRTVTVRLLSKSPTWFQEDELSAAKAYTRRLFWNIYEGKMDWDRLDFAYLVLPPDQSRFSSSTPAWLDVDELSDASLPHTCTSIPAEDFGKEHDYPEDEIVLVKAGSKQFRFVRWHFDRLPEEMEDLLRQNSKLVPDGEWEYPLMVVEPLPVRTNFLVPLPLPRDGDGDGLSREEKREKSLRYMHPRFGKVYLVGEKDVERGLLLPSILRAMQLSITTQLFKETILQSPTAHPSLSDIPTSLLLTAITAPVSQESTNYQRLETLGDTVLKLLTSVQLLAEYPLWHEGYLSRRKDHAVCNARLAREAIGRELWRWIVRDMYAGKKWSPKLLEAEARPQQASNSPQSAADVAPMDVDVVPSSGETAANTQMRSTQRKIKRRKGTQQLSLKVIADVVESTIGAAYLSGGLSVALECVKVFDLGIQWKDLHVRFQTLFDRASSTPQPGHVIPPQLEHVETILGYRFKNKILLQEALTHSGYQPTYETADTVSYERMEFLGDAVLDMVATDFLYRAQPPDGKLYKPGHIHLRKSALVNAHFLAYICLRQSRTVKSAMPRPEHPVINARIVIEEEEQEVWLFQCLLHSTHQIVDAQRDVRTRYTKGRAAIDSVLFDESIPQEGKDRDTQQGAPAKRPALIFPWSDLSRVQAPKLFSDMIESLVGAVYIDSLGNFEAVTAVLEQLGWMGVMRRIVDQSIDVQHPVSRLHIWATRVGKKIKYTYKQAEGIITCSILVDGVKKGEASGVYTGVASQNEAKFRAAEAFNLKYTVDDASLDPGNTLSPVRPRL